VLEVAFIPLEQAIKELAEVGYVPIQDPPVAYLSGNAAAGKIYRYRVTPTHEAVLLE
jgi:hypothetical protein